MSKPSIGNATTPVQKQEQEIQIKELTVLEEGSAESIYNLVFKEQIKVE